MDGGGFVRGVGLRRDPTRIVIGQQGGEVSTRFLWGVFCGVFFVGCEPSVFADFQAAQLFV